MLKAITKNILKNLLFYIAYLSAGGGACLLALFLSVYFLSPAVSQEASSAVASENAATPPQKLSAKKIFKDIVKNTQDLISKISGKNNKTQNPASGQGIEAGLMPQEESPAGGFQQPPPIDGQVPGPQQPANAGPALQEVPQMPESPADITGSPTAGGFQQPPPLEGQVPGPQQPANTGPAVQEGVGSFMEASPQGGAPSETQNVEAENFSRQPAAVNNPGQQENYSPADLEVQSYMAPFIYESVKQKNPFDDPTAQQQTDKGIIIIPRTPPEKYDLSDIRLKGMIWNSSTPKALFELPGNSGFFTLLKGDKIGKNGVIFTIREDEVVIVETNPIGSGRQRKEERVIKIKKMDRMGLSSSI